MSYADAAGDIGLFLVFIAILVLLGIVVLVTIMFVILSPYALILTYKERFRKIALLNEHPDTDHVKDIPNKYTLIGAWVLTISAYLALFCELLIIFD